jgi:beta-glucanase (GH16 family)
MPAHNRYGYWPRSGEIDILEHLGRTGEVTNGYSTIHCTNASGAHQQRFRVAKGKDWSKDWHTWGCLWDKTPGGREYFRFYVDNVQYGEITEQEWSPWGREPGAPFDQPFYLIFNLAVGGPWAGAASSSISGKYLEIDWVRVYRAP